MRLNNSLSIVLCSGVIGHIFTFTTFSAIGLTGAEVNKVAEKATVFIRGVENADNFGSGVLIHRNGQEYKVLTAAHVVELPDQYTVTTSDNLQHKILERRKLPNIDLAEITFQSSETYLPAKIGDASQLFPTARVFVSGFPKPGFNIPVPTYTITDGNITTIINQSMRDGYGIAYTNPTRSGMSGGPVFNEEAKVIGIHGRKEGEIDGSQTIGAWLNLGIPINLYQDNIIGGGKLDNISVLGLGKQTQSSISKPSVTRLQLALIPIPTDASTQTKESLYDSEIKQYCDPKSSTFNSQFDCRTVIKLKPINESTQEANLEQIKDYLLRAHHAYQSNNYQQSISFFSQALTLSPQNPVALHNRGVAYYAAQQTKNALYDFQSSLREFEEENNQTQVLYLKNIIQQLNQEIQSLEE